MKTSSTLNFQCNIIVEFTVMGMGRVGDYANRTFFPDKPLWMTNTLCLLFKVIHETGIPLCALTFMLIALERLMATLLIKTYEAKTNVVGMTILITTVSRARNAEACHFPETRVGLS